MSSRREAPAAAYVITLLLGLAITVYGVTQWQTTVGRAPGWTLVLAGVVAATGSVVQLARGRRNPQD